METLKQSFGRRFRALRESRGHSREFLAQNVKLEPTSIFRVEKGEQWIAPEKLDAAAKFYGVSPAVFFTDDIVKIEPTPEEALDVLSKALFAKPAHSTAEIDDFSEEERAMLEQAIIAIRETRSLREPGKKRKNQR